VFGDYDNDADADLFVGNEEGPNRLFRNERGVSFQEVTPAEGLSLGSETLGAAFFDHDNDGDLDLLTTSLSPAFGGDQLYQNQGEYLAPVGHLLALEPESTGRGVSFGDYDGDGDVDWFVADAEHSRLYRNQMNQNHWLQVDLAGVGLNPDGLGARVEVSAQGDRQYREAQSTYGYCTQVQPWVHFGLGVEAQVDTLRVRWPDGQETVETGVAADQLLTVRHPNLITAVLDDQGVQPTSFALWANYPNPFNAATIISYQVAQAEHVMLTVYNVAGQPVKRLVNEVQKAGRYRVSWDGSDDAGRAAGSAVYFCHMEAGNYRQTRRLVLLK
jgi:hypothetical protein